ncbi:hypothetical protein POX_f07858 [Penicillium oxalicum]|uniref:Uncharacterized protein n=1 Tax=Penicillium oxalicum (strain 114-2 / CGMCC 5302) TaxID=933388 RepID=S7ZDQ1_PENO1|nr:hypothetical protein POX_f07858 [Penicillium oxalicum]EPS28780.1 hypothetical protein PDE_03726 [Penicillium oxalicum 114-2]KAI2787492.1 hypothetical protein POX_f07858 [Penicillium oxalicum]
MAEIYNTDRFAELYYPSNTADLLQLGLAARFIASLLEAHQITYAFIGGWAVYLRGGRRRTQDIDITVATTMDHLKHILIAQSRIHFPLTHGRTSVQVFIDTGRSVDGEFPHVPDLAVSMDIVISGHLGTPEDLQSSREPINPRRPTPLGSPVLVLGLVFQIYAKLDAFFHRGEQGSKDFLDLEFLFTQYAADIPTFREYYDLEQRRYFWTQYAEAYVAFPDQVESMRALLGV